MISSVHRGTVAPPRMLTYTVSFSCNARCIMCDSWKMDSPNELTTDEVSRIFDQLPELDFVRLTGGEPFVRKDMLELANLTQRKLKPFVLHVTTNGFLTSRIMEFCEKRDRTTPLAILVSLDGTKTKHNHVRGRESAWDTATATLRAIAPRRRELAVSLAVNQTIVDAESAREYRKLGKLLADWQIDHNAVIAYKDSATYSQQRDQDVAPTSAGEFTTWGQFTREELLELLSQLDNDAGKLPFVNRLAKRYYLRGIRNRLLHHRGAPNPRCAALNATLRIFPNGDVPTCQFNSRIVGNLRRQTFQEVWNCDAMRDQRQWVRKCPGCWAECEVLPNAIYSGDILGEAMSSLRR
ncbi:radical SAM protein [Candidatus Sumerlaeota bacterium]|nr:radical SAM protein [Candidatus Sumerlaeota bacterium]